MAPVLCAGVTTYRGLKNSRARPGQFAAIIGAGGLGHIAIQYVKAVGLRPIAVDVDPAKLDLARRLGAEMVFHAVRDGTQAIIDATGGGCHAVLVTATAPAAFEQGIKITRPGGTTVFIGIPPTAQDLCALSIGDLVNAEKSVRGSNIGTRLDLQEAVDFAARLLVVPEVEAVPFADAADALDRLRAGQVTGRLVLRLAP